MIDLILRNAVLPDGRSGLDLAIDSGRLLKISSHLETEAHLEYNLGGRLLTPGFVDPHLHLDIALMNPSGCPGRAQPFVSLAELNAELEERRGRFSPEEIANRAGAAIELAVRHGVTAIRAQCHVDPTVGLTHLEALIKVKELYADLITLQIVTFPQQGLTDLDMFREAFHLGANVMGCAPNLDRSLNFRRHIDAALGLAMELDVDLDVHADLGIPQHVELEDLEVVYLARRVIETGYRGRVSAGHVSALDSALPDVAAQAIDLIHQARINVISQPDLYRLGREDQHHVRRGLTRVKQLLEAGVNVAFASNNVRDAMRPLGNLNPLEEGLILAYGAHMDTRDDLNTLLLMCTNNAARAIRLEYYGLEPGCQADLVVLEAATPSAAIVGQVEKRFVFKAGRLIAANQLINQSFFEKLTGE
ncbi:MAG: amidohydrolase family protein [Anaerolineaceae bacterium]